MGLKEANSRLKGANSGLKGANSGLEGANLGLKEAKSGLILANLGAQRGRFEVSDQLSPGLDGPIWAQMGPFEDPMSQLGTWTCHLVIL